MAGPEVLALGHAARDLVPGGWTLGGGVAFAARTAYALGRMPAVVTSGDVRDLTGQLPGLLKVKPAVTTIFENRETPTGRRQRLLARAAELDLEDIPREWRDAPIVLLAPICQEFAPALAAAFPRSLVVACLQGWLRQWDAQGNISPRLTPPFTVPGARALTASSEDFGGDEAAAAAYCQPAVAFVLTHGRAGATLFWKGEAHAIPAVPVNERSPTGAGDVFATALAIRLAETSDPLAAAHFASQVAARAVATDGWLTRADLADLRQEQR